MFSRKRIVIIKPTTDIVLKPKLNSFFIKILGSVLKQNKTK